MSADGTSNEKRQTVRSRLVNILDNATRYLRHAGRRPEPEDPPVEPWHVTRKGNGITPLSQSKWYSDHTGATEFKHHVGRSVEGHHGGLEVSHHGGEGPFYWSNARRTPEGAERASWGIRDWYERGDCRKTLSPDSKPRERSRSWER